MVKRKKSESSSAQHPHFIAIVAIVAVVAVVILVMNSMKTIAPIEEVVVEDTVVGDEESALTGEAFRKGNRLGKENFISKGSDTGSKKPKIISNYANTFDKDTTPSNPSNDFNIDSLPSMKVTGLGFISDRMLREKYGDLRRNDDGLYICKDFGYTSCLAIELNYQTNPPLSYPMLLELHRGLGTAGTARMDPCWNNGAGLSWEGFEGTKFRSYISSVICYNIE